MKGREGKGREGWGREGKGREGKGSTYPSNTSFRKRESLGDTNGTSLKLVSGVPVPDVPDIPDIKCAEKCISPQQ